MHRLPRWMAIGLAALVSAVTFGVTVRFAVTASTNRCASGFDGLGCVIVFALAAVVASLLVAAVPGAIVLALGGVARPFLVATFAALNVGVALALIRALSTTGARAAIVVIAAFGVFNALYDALFNRLRLPLPTALVVGVIALVVSYGPMTRLGQGVDRHNDARSQRHELQHVGFTVYEPTFMPREYRVYSARLVGLRTDPPYYEIEYLAGKNVDGDRIPYSVFVFSRLASYHPPNDCGPEQPIGRLQQPCVLVNTSSAGSPVFVSRPPNTNIVAWFTAIGDTEVTIRTSTDRAPLTDDEARRIFDSLRRKRLH